MVADATTPAHLYAFLAVGSLWILEVSVSQQPPVPVPDYRLLLRVAEEDERALGELYDRFGAAMYSLAMAVVGNSADAEEVVADAFAQVWRTAGRYDPARGSVGAWLSTITRTRGLDLLRSRKRRLRALERSAATDRDGLALEISAPSDAPDRQAEHSDDQRLVGRSLADLPEAQRRVIELAYFRGLSQSEIAAELKQPLGTVKTRMRSGMEKLRKALTPYLSELRP